MTIKSWIRAALGERAYGRIEYFLRPKLRRGQPLNGQVHRQKMFRDIIGTFPLRAIVETGAFRGTTTQFFSSLAVPVYAVEINPRFFAYCKARFRHVKQWVSMFEGDSRTFLRQLSEAALVPLDSMFFISTRTGRKICRCAVRLS